MPTPPDGDPIRGLVTTTTTTRRPSTFRSMRPSSITAMMSTSDTTPTKTASSSSSSSNTPSATTASYASVLTSLNNETVNNNAVVQQHAHASDDGSNSSSSSVDQPLHQAQQQQQQQQQQSASSGLERHLTLCDLIAIGVGGTIGSGLFVLAGLVAHRYAGPATAVSWVVSGAAAGLSGCCYAELAARLPRAGGSYAWTRAALGPHPSLLAGACLTTDYVGAAAAVSRSWGDKCLLWLHEEGVLREATIIGDRDHHHHSRSFNPLAGLIAAGSVALLLAGVKESKRATNLFTSVKVALSVFMVVAGLCWTQPANWTQPDGFSPFGVAGVLRGATGTFFGFLGYDAVCCLGGEAVRPRRNLPVAILATLGSVTVLYVLATVALCGMQSYPDISPVAGFPHAFYSLHHNWAGQIAAAGEILTLPVVVLITIMAQPRLMHAMSVDGLLPPVARRVDRHGNLWHATLASGAVMVAVATFVPFTHLNDMISFAVLSILNMADSSLILLWHTSDAQPRLAASLVAAFHGAALTTAAVLSTPRYLQSLLGGAVVTLSAGAMVAAAGLLYVCCPRSATFGGSRMAVGGGNESSDCNHVDDDDNDDDDYFRTPLVPFWPLLGIFVNWYLIAQLDWVGVASMVGCLLLATAYYVFVVRRHRADWGIHSNSSNNHGQHSYHQPAGDNDEDERAGPIEMTQIHNDDSHDTLDNESDDDDDSRPLPALT